MCESIVFLEEKGEVREMLRDVARIVSDDGKVVCTSIIGERVVMDAVRFKEANFLSHGIVFTRD
ncbi:MAG: CooT family nickel-binding protein [Methanomassiliicoccales archaeon]|jgi:predicted RNA-binding protein|nr:CooT family nickel-binding protein [Methanomassiliicoccales archaeon]